MTSIKLKKKKEKDGHEVVGKIITVFFIILLAVGIYFLVDLFRQREINYDTICGTWKLSGDPAVIYKFEKYDENKGFGAASIREEGGEQINYRYTLETKTDGNYKLLHMQQIDIGGYKVGEEMIISVTGVSKAQLSLILESKNMKSLSRQDLF